MNQITTPPRLEVIPETAPFSEGQRSWLNGFLVGLLQLDGSVPLSPEQGAAVLQGVAGDGDDGEAPWHDQTMPIADRMKLAEGRPLRRRMMAAMAQQDCGQCGYDCKKYSGAIFEGKEARLNLCVPGGKETARMLKTLHAEIGAALGDSYTLEVSSAGLDRPLRLERGDADFRRFEGRLVKVVTKEPVGGQSAFAGRLAGVDGEMVLMTEGRRTHRVPLGKISRARLEVEF